MKGEDREEGGGISAARCDRWSVRMRGSKFDCNPWLWKRVVNGGGGGGAYHAGS